MPGSRTRDDRRRLTRSRGSERAEISKLRAEVKAHHELVARLERRIDRLSSAVSDLREKIRT
jgi:ubiquinone biosynthesis protein UbiJ